MYKNILLKVAYDGTNFQGWQEQAGPGRTVAGELQRALEEETGKPVRMIAAGRTDAGVHAEGQLVNFLTTDPTPADVFYHKLRPYLPEDLMVIRSAEVPLNFHVRFQAKAKTYRYDLLEAPYLLPQARHHFGLCSYPLNEEIIRKALPLFIGTHNFSAFSLQDKDRDPIRTLMNIELDRQGNHWTFHLTGDSFLRRQVRILIGSLIDLGRGHLKLEQIPTLLKEGADHPIAPAFPAAGLTLEDIEISLEKTFPDPVLTQKIQRFSCVYPHSCEKPLSDSIFAKGEPGAEGAGAERIFRGR